MRTRLLTAFFLAVLSQALVGCGASAPTSVEEPVAEGSDGPASPGEPAAVGRRELARGLGVLVLPEREAADYYDVHGNAAADGFFTPSDADVEAALDALGPALAGLPRAEGPAAFDDYHVHLVGVVRGGQRQVFVFGFRDPGSHAWTAAFAVDDGGDGFFEGAFDLASSAFVEIAFHGEA